MTPDWTQPCPAGIKSHKRRPFGMKCADCYFDPMGHYSRWRAL